MFNTWLIISVCVGFGLLLLGLCCSIGANKRFEKYKNKIEIIPVESGINTSDLLDYIADYGELDTERITLITTADENAYSAKDESLLLSCDIIDSNSIYALTCTAHELGHAKEHQRGSTVFGLWYKFAILEQFTCKLILPLCIIGFILGLIPGWTSYLGTFMMNISTLFTICAILGKLITLPTEQHASAYAIELLQSSGIMNKKELKQAEKLLNFALGTYFNGFYERLFYNFIFVGKIIKKTHSKLKKGDEN